MKIIAFAASNSKKSINKQLVSYAAGLKEGAQVEVLDLNDFEMPLYSGDREEESGIPDLAQQFFKKLGEADAILISFAEHNGSYSAAYKNTFDWTSRIDQKVFQGKPMVLMSTSPGPGGAKNVLAAAKTSAPYFGGEVKADFSLPSFFDNFDSEKGEVSSSELREQLQSIMSAF